MIQAADLSKLAETRGLSLTIFEPLQDGDGRPSDPASRITAAAHEVLPLLATRGFDAESADEFIRPVVHLAKNTDWSGRTGSVAIFRSPGFTETTFCPGNIPPASCLSDEFLLLPLFCRSLAPEQFWLIALNLKNVRLFRGDAREFHEVDPGPKVPRSLEAAGEFDFLDHDLENRSTTGAGRLAAVIRFGTGNEREVRNRKIADFFRKIDSAVRNLVPRDGTPVILAGIAREITTYRRISKVSGLLPSGITESPAHLSDSMLHQQALQLLRSSDADAAKAVERLMNAAANRHVLILDPATIFDSANSGRVKRLFLDPARTNGDNLVNSAALAVVRNSGSVICRGAQETPYGIAAELRYRVPRAAASASAEG
ncbi:MAG TPA: hypothetical protein VHC90_09380 [Bryobacteraceae bacterium]|nr:hypothetical protein [Bryobacteraceae bacterium]